MPIIYIQKFKTLFAIIRIKYRTFLFKFAESLHLHIANTSKGVTIVQQVTVLGRGKIQVGKNSHLGGYPGRDFLRGDFFLEARNSTSQIIIGKNVFINNNCTIIADRSTIEIGDDTLIGQNFCCLDSDFHPTDPAKRRSDDYICKSVKIGNNVFIGAGVTVLKGVCIGDDAVIAAGTLVVKNVPRATVFAGNPGKFIRSLPI